MNIVLWLVNLDYLHQHCTIVVYLNDYVNWLFFIMQFVVGASIFNINYITNFIGVSEFLGIFVYIINVNLSLFICGCNYPINNWRDVKYYFSSK